MKLVENMEIVKGTNQLNFSTKYVVQGMRRTKYLYDILHLLTNNVFFSAKEMSPSYKVH